MAQSGRNTEMASGIMGAKDPTAYPNIKSPGMSMDSNSGGNSGSTTGNKRFDVKGTNISMGLGGYGSSTPMEPAPARAASTARVDSGSNYGASRGSSFSNAMKGGMASWGGSSGGMMGLGKMD